LPAIELLRCLEDDLFLNAFFDAILASEVVDLSVEFDLGGEFLKR